MSANHTPAPWVVEGESATQLRVRAELRFNVAKVLRLDSLYETKANARLISAAPELLEALNAIVTHGEPIYPADWVRMKAAGLAAIAKAKGTQ